MGRDYWGDIEGRFWFAVQSSTAADRFGVTGTPPNQLDYYFDEDNLEDIEAEIDNITLSIRQQNLKVLNDFFKTCEGYNDKIMKDAGIDVDMWNAVKQDYADLELGIEIRDQVKQEGSCSFTAEL